MGEQKCQKEPKGRQRRMLAAEAKEAAYHGNMRDTEG